MFKAAVLTVSDRAANGDYEDKTGPVVCDVLQWWQGVEVALTSIVPDEVDAIRAVIEHWVDLDGVTLVITNGGTGISLRDVTPEATAGLIDVQIPGMAELMRLRSFDSTPTAALSRGIAGRRGKALILNVPGSVTGARQCLEAVSKVVPHALQQLDGGGH